MGNSNFGIMAYFRLKVALTSKFHKGCDIQGVVAHQKANIQFYLSA